MREFLPRAEWTTLHALAVARLVIDPESNGGTESELTAEMVMDAWPKHAPAWAVFEGEEALFCVGLNPFEWNPDLTRLRGILHFARRPSMPPLLAYRTVVSFLDALPGVEVMTFTDRPGLVRLGVRAGLLVLGMEGPYTVLGR